MEAMKVSEKSELRSSSSSTITNDMSQSISLFKKYLTRSQNNIGTTNTEESQIIKNCPSNNVSSLPPPKCNPSLDRPPSLLERKLLPELRVDGVLPSSVLGDRSSTAQLTIFYDGAINVYDNVPIDKAQAIMLLAGESSSSNTSTESQEMDTESLIHQSNVIPRSKLKTGLPIARRHSLQFFLQKRRDRKLAKKSSPYASAIPSLRNKSEASKNEEGTDQINGVSLSPFPSRLGFSVPISVDKAC